MSIIGVPSRRPGSDVDGAEGRVRVLAGSRDRTARLLTDSLVERLAAAAALVLWLLLAGPCTAMGVQSPPLSGGPPPTQPPGRRVLLLFTEPRLTPALIKVDAALRGTIESQSPVPVSVYTEYLDTNMFDGEVPLAELRELLRRKYATRPPDVILAAGSRALRIALHNRAALFSSAAVVFIAVDPVAAADLQLDADVTGTWLHLGWGETLDLARRLQPEIRRAVLVHGSSPVDRTWMAAARRQLAVGVAIKVDHLADRSLEEILREVKSLPAHSVVLVGPFLRDAMGRDFPPVQVIRAIAASASVPVYAVSDATIGTGVVGGQLVRWEAHGQAAAELALRVLAGDRWISTKEGTTEPVFDARQLKRWKIDARRLPSESIVLFQEPSVWALYRWYTISAVGVLLIQGALIGGLLIQRAQRRRAQERLAERLRFETLLSYVSAVFASGASSQVDGQIDTALRRLGEDLAIDRASLTAFNASPDEVRVTHSWTRDDIKPLGDLIHGTELPWMVSELRRGRIVRFGRPGDLPVHAAIDRQSVKRLGTRSGVVVPLIVGGSTVGGLAVATLREERSWSDELVPRLRILAELFASALGRRDAERTAHESASQIQSLAGRLITAQEEERSRIARELHDGVNQELTALSIALTTLGRRVSTRAPDLTSELARLQARAGGLVAEIRHLSHELHPGVLQHVGLVAALEGYCEEFGGEHGLRVTFQADEDLGVVPIDRALCLYRATQEALGNTAKHAKARLVRVTVARNDGKVLLTVADDGCGFDLGEARGRGGLGLISLDERVRLVGGQVTINTSRLGGTEVRIVVPLPESLAGAPEGPPR